MADLKQVLGSLQPRAKLLAAVSPKSSRFLEAAPNLEHIGYLQQPELSRGLIMLTKNSDRASRGLY